MVARRNPADSEANLEEQYARLVSAGIPAGTKPEPALARLGQLIDLSCDLRRPDGLRTSLTWADQLAGRGFPDSHSVHLHYFIGNAWAGLDELLHQGQESTWRWEREEAEREILHLRTALGFAARASVPPEQLRPVHTNLGNALSKIGRFVEAHDHWSDALALDADFAMAIGNRAFGLLHYAQILFDPGHAALFVQECRDGLTRALAGRLEPHARPQLEAALARTQEAAVRMGLPEDSLFHEHSLGDSVEESAYRTWCLRNRLFVNPLNDLRPHSIAAADVMHLPSISLGFNEPPSVLGNFNQLKQEFVSARYMYYEAVTALDTHFSDRHVKLLNTLDYPAYGLSVERAKAAFRTAYSVLDKLAFFFNDYLKLGISPRSTSFRSFWYRNQTRGQGLRDEFTTRPNWPLRGLYWLSKDLSEDRTGFREAMTPDAQDLASIRNHLEHRYLKLHGECWVASQRSADAEAGSSMDTLARSVDREDFEAKTLRLLKLARAALIYTSLAVHSEERAKDRNRSPEVVVAPMPTDVWEDEWKL